MCIEIKNPQIFPASYYKLAKMNSFESVNELDTQLFEFQFMKLCVR